MTDAIENEVQELEGFEEILQSCDSGDLLSCGYPFSRSGDAVQQGINETDMTADFIIVTRSKDINRNGNQVQIAESENSRGLMLENYSRNPVVLFNHGHSIPFPIARSSVPKLSKSKAEATATFSQSNPDAAIIFGLIAEGILNTASISFLPYRAKLYKPSKKKKTQLEEGEVEFKPWQSLDFTESDVLEWSVVDIPADADAVRKHLDLGHIHGERITQGMKRVMQGMCPQEKKAQSGPGPEELRRRRIMQELPSMFDGFADKAVERVKRELTARTDKLAREVRRATGR